jgi:hypothetical protein
LRRNMLIQVYFQGDDDDDDDDDNRDKLVGIVTAIRLNRGIKIPCPIRTRTLTSELIRNSTQSPTKWVPHY